MYLSQKEKNRHPEYEQYIALFEETITQMESGARGRGAPEAIIERCLDKALEFYDADSAALVETNLDLGYGVCVSEHCKKGVRSFEGRIIGVTPEETPYLYEKVMALEVFDVYVQKERGQLSNNEYSMLTRMGVEVFAVAPYLKRYSGYVYIRNPRRFVGLYGFLQAVSYIGHAFSLHLTGVAVFSFFCFRKRFGSVEIMQSGMGKLMNRSFHRLDFAHALPDGNALFGGTVIAIGAIVQFFEANRHRGGTLESLKKL